MGCSCLRGEGRSAVPFNSSLITSTKGCQQSLRGGCVLFGNILSQREDDIKSIEIAFYRFDSILFSQICGLI